MCVCACMLWKCTLLQVKCFLRGFSRGRFSVSACLSSFTSAQPSHCRSRAEESLMCFYRQFADAWNVHDPRIINMQCICWCVAAAWWCSAGLLEKSVLMHIDKKQIHPQKWIWIIEWSHSVSIIVRKAGIELKCMWCAANGLERAETLKWSFKCWNINKMCVPLLWFENNPFLLIACA